MTFTSSLEKNKLIVSSAQLPAAVPGAIPSRLVFFPTAVSVGRMINESLSVTAREGEMLCLRAGLTPQARHQGQ